MRTEGLARLVSTVKKTRRLLWTGLKPLLARMISFVVEANSIRPRLFPTGKCSGRQREEAFNEPGD